MLIAAIVIGSLFALWVLAELKTSRPDGTLVGNVHKYRQMMFHIMPTRNGSVVYYDTYVRAERLLAYLEAARERFGADVTHILVGAALGGFAQAEKMNRFVIGRRMYQRDGVYVTFSMKRQQGDEQAKLATVKLARNDGERFDGLCARIDEQISHQRSGKRTHEDKEYDLFTLLPRAVLARLVRLTQWLNDHNLLPSFFIRDDPMHTSMFVANLGSLQMAPGFHHLYEWGTCPLFVMVGQLEKRALVDDAGEVEVATVLPIRFSYDERIDDGLTARRGIFVLTEILADPERYLGCIDDKHAPALGEVAVPEERLAVRR